MDSKGGRTRDVHNRSKLKKQIKISDDRMRSDEGKTRLWLIYSRLFYLQKYKRVKNIIEYHEAYAGNRVIEYEKIITCSSAVKLRARKNETN